MRADLGLLFNRRRRQRAQERAAQRALREGSNTRSSDPLQREYAAMLQGLESLRDEESPVRYQARAAWLRAERRSNRHGRVAAFAAAACAFVLMFAVVPLYRAFVPQFESSYSPPVSTTAGVALPDGSGFKMNVDARASVRYYADRREVTLHDGEAFFTVARDPTRRFEVAAGTVRVRATGTQFNVRLRGNWMEVAVREGSVAVIDTRGGQEIALSAGQRIRYAEGRAGAVRDDIPPDMIGAWKDGFLAVYRLPLADLPSELARYRTPRVEVAREIGRLQISGAFRLGDFDGLIESIVGIHPIQVERFAGGVRLLPAPAGDFPLQLPVPSNLDGRARPSR